MDALRVYLLFLGCMFVGITSGARPCMPGWAYSARSRRCYKFVKIKLNWMRARGQCQRMNGDLSVIRTAFINKFFFGKLKLNEEVWMGLNDRDVEGKYTWNYNQHLPLYYSWKGGEPNSQGDCASAIKQSSKVVWKMNNCLEKKKFYCDRPRNDELKLNLPASCGSSSWRRHIPSNKCVRSFDNGQTWDDARAVCEKFNAKLVDVGSFDMHDFLHRTLGKASAYWIGANDRKKEGVYAWLDNDTPVKYLMWKDTYPKHGGRNCVAMASEGRENLFIDENCDTKLGFTCERDNKKQEVTPTAKVQTTTKPKASTAKLWKPTTVAVIDTTAKAQTTTVPPPSCPDDTWTMYEQAAKCLKIVTRKANWRAAREGCKNLGGDLVAIPDAGTHDFIKGIMGRERYWIGLHDFDLDGRWKWLDDTTETTYTAWYTRPRNLAGGEYCTEMIGNKGGKWNDKRCTVRRQYICQLTSNDKDVA